MSFEIVREKPYFINADGEKKTYIDTTDLMSFIGFFINEDGEQFTYKFGYDFNSDEYVGIEIVDENKMDYFKELFIARLSNSYLETKFSIESFEQKIVQECFSGDGQFIIKKFSENYDCFFV